MKYVLNTWKVGLESMCNSTWLSQNNKANLEWSILKSFKRATNQVKSHTTIAWYSFFVEDQDTMVCFLILHEIKESPKNMQYPVVDLLESIQKA